MIIKWYNRDNISDVEMKQARLVADRLHGKNKESPDGITVELLQKAYREAMQSPFLPNQMVVSPSRYQVLKNTNPFGWEPAPQWAKDAKENNKKDTEPKPYTPLVERRCVTCGLPVHLCQHQVTE